MDLREQEEIYPLQLLLEAANEQLLAAANKNNAIAAKLGPHAYDPIDVPTGLSPIASVALGAAASLNIPFNYASFTKTMTRYARAHETSPGQYPHLDVRCLSFCFTHPSSATIVRRLVDITLGRSPMLIDTPADGAKVRSRNASSVAPQENNGASDGALAVDSESEPEPEPVEDEEEDETDPDVIAEREKRRARRRLREAVDLNCLRALEHNLGITFTRELTFIQDIKVKRGEGVRLGKDDAPLIDLDAEGFGAVKAAGPKRSAAPKTTRAAQLKVLVAAGKIPSHRRGASAPAKQLAPRGEDLGWEVRTVEQSSVNELQLIRQIQASHDALRNLLQLALDKTGVRMKSGVLVRTVMTQFINANHLGPLISLFEVMLRSELPPIASATERVATKAERHKLTEDAAKPATSTPAPAPASDSSAHPEAARSVSTATMVDTECQTSPLPTKVRVVYVKEPSQAPTRGHTISPSPRRDSAKPHANAKDAAVSTTATSHRKTDATTAANAKAEVEALEAQAVEAERAYAARVINRILRGRLGRKRASMVRDGAQSPTRVTSASAAPAATTPSPARSQQQQQQQQPTAPSPHPVVARSATLVAPERKETPRRERRPPPSQTNDDLRSSPVQQPPQRAWFEEVDATNQPSSTSSSSLPPQHRAPATPEAARPTTKPDSRQAPHDRRPLPREDRHSLAAVPQQDSSRRTTARVDTDSPAITVTDELGSSRVIEDEDPDPQHHVMPPVHSSHAVQHQPAAQLAPQPAPQQQQRTIRLPPVPIAASREDVRPELQPLLYQMAARYQIASGRPPATLPPIASAKSRSQQPIRRPPGTAVMGADGKAYLGDIEVALGLKKTRAMIERDDAKRRAKAEAEYFARNAPGSRLLASTPQPEYTGQITRVDPPGAPLVAPVQRPPRRPGGAAVLSPMRNRSMQRQPPTSITPEPMSTATVGGVPFDKLSRVQQQAVIRALAASMLDADDSGAVVGPSGTNQTSPGDDAAARHRRAGEQRRRDDETSFNDFLLEQQQRALFEEQHRAKRQAGAPV